MMLSLKTGCDILYLAYCVLCNGIVDEKRVKQMNLKEVFQYSKLQSLDSITYAALEGCSELTGVLLDEWRNCSRKAQRKEILFDIERKELEDWMEENGIWYIPLKGCVLKSLYPRVGIRQMADQDILFDSNFRTELHDWFVARGYEAEVFGVSNHDVYLKNPVLNFEMHVELYSDKFNLEMYEYWKDIKERSVQLKDKNYGFQMTTEDFYLYLLCHSHKHFSHSGTGIRILLDLFVYLNKYSSIMDWDYIYKELDKLGLKDFESEINQLQNSIFSNGESFQNHLSEKQKDMLSYMLGAGTYGREDFRLKNQLYTIQGNKENLTFFTKLKYYYRRVFPDKKYFNQNEELSRIYKNPFKRVSYIIKRIFSAIFINRKRIVKEMKCINDAK